MKSDEFIREVDEELQQEKLAELWKRYGNLVAAVVLVVVGGTAGYVAWQNWSKSQREAEAARYLRAAAIGQSLPPAETAKALESFAATATDGFRTVARMKAADASLTSGDKAAAVAALEKVGADGSADPLLREAAKIMAIGQQLGTLDPAAAIAALEPHAAAGAPWRHYARQLLAAAHLQKGDKAAARKVLEQLTSDGEAPLSAQKRAQELIDSFDDSRGAPP